MFASLLIEFILATEEKVSEDDDEETMASRFVARLLKHLMKGFHAKDKNVRYRVLQIVAEMISHLGEIEYVRLIFSRVNPRANSSSVTMFIHFYVHH